MENLPAMLLGCVLALSACTSDPSADDPGSSLASSDTTAEDGQEPTTTAEDGTDGDGADADTDPDGPDADDGDGNVDPGPTTPQTIVPPGETAPAPTDDSGNDGGQGGEPTTSTTVDGVETTDPSQQPIQEQDTALVCATVEQGYIAVLSGEDDLSSLESGAQLAVDSGAADYVTLGEELQTALSNDADVRSAADALLTRCEADGFERLA